MTAPHMLDLPAGARKALADSELQTVLDAIRQLFPLARRAAVEALPEFDSLRDDAVALKDHTLAHLDVYLELFEEKVRANGGTVHWARTAEEARGIVLGICRAENAATVIKGKSMVTEEIDLNEHLEANGIGITETDLGEYIIQLRGERPSHIIGPALHLSPAQVADTFRDKHGDLDAARALDDPQSLLNEARQVLRERFFTADLGITGANFLIAETGQAVIASNEGNGGLSMTLPQTHIVVASIEKVVPTLNDAATLLRLLARSATGQELTSYTTFVTGPRRANETDGPKNFHVVLIDNGRSSLVGTDLQYMLRCIKCSACLNHCPVYTAIGGHAYGWVYTGPMGAVLTPALTGLEHASHLPNASTFCGKCEEVCPLRIPLPRLMRHWREKEFERHLPPLPARAGLKLWAFLARHPHLYRILMGLAMRVLALAGGKQHRLASLPFGAGWTATRDMPAPEGRTFLGLMKRQSKEQPS